MPARSRPLLALCCACACSGAGGDRRGDPGGGADGATPALADGEVRRFEAVAAAAHGDGDEAGKRRALEAILARRPDDASGHAALGALDRQRGDLAAARDELERAVTLDPAPRNAHHDLALTCRRLGRGEDTRIELAAFDALERREEDLPPAAP